MKLGTQLDILVVVILTSLVVILTVLGDSLFLPVFVLLCSLIATPWYISFRQGQFDIFEPIIFKSAFIAMIGVVLVDRVYLQDNYFAYDVISRNFTEAFLVVTGLYIILFASILIGYYSPIGKRAIPTGELFTVNNYRVRLVSIIAGGYILIGIAAYAAFIFLAVPRADVFYLFTTTTPRSEIFSDNQILVTASRLAYIGYFLWLTCAITKYDGARIRDLLLLPILLGMFALMGSRYTVMLILLTTVILYYYAYYFGLIRVRHPRLQWVTDVPSIIKTAVVGFGGLIAAAVIPLAQHLRLGRSPTEAIERTDYIGFFTSGIHDTIPDNLLAVIEVVPEEFGYYYGTMYIRSVTNFIPRAVWEDKPVLTTGGLLRRAILPDQAGGRDPGEIGSYFVNFGWMGPIIMGVVFGILIRIFYETLVENNNSPFIFLVYAFALISVVRAGLVNNMLVNLFTSVIIISPVIMIHVPQIITLGKRIRNQTIGNIGG